MNQRKNPIRIALCASIAFGAWLAAAPAQADCRAELAALDEKLAGAEGIDQNRRQMLQGLRDTAARHCDQGQEQLASRMIGAVEGQLAHLTDASGDDAEPQPSRPKSELTAGYLEGMWCMSSDRHDRIYPIRFEPDGAHLVGQPAGDKYGMFPNGDELDDFYRGFDRLVSRQSDEFVVIDRGRELTYRRGTCPGIEIAG